MNIETLNRARNIALSAILAAGLTLPTTAVAYAADGDGSSSSDEVKDKLDKLIADDEDDNSPAKSESVYVFANADGSVKNTVVTNWLKNTTGASTIQDVSSLDDIKNTEGKETYTADGEALTWQADGNDIYYQGNTDKSAPISIKVTYWLDGAEVAPANLAGKSGHVKIRFQYTNNSSTVEYVDGAARTVYTPFACVTGMVLDNDVFRNVKTKNAKAMNDGDRTLVGGYAFPGLQDDLGLDRDTVDLPDYFEIEADVTDFEMGTTATLVTSNLLDSLNADEIDSDLGDSLDKLSEAMDQLIDGSSQLYDGMRQLDDGGAALAAGTAELQDKTAELPGSAQQLADGSNALATGLGTAVDGTDQLIAGNTDLEAGLKLLKEGGKLSNGFSSAGLVGALDGVDQLAAGSETMSDGLKSLDSGLVQAKDGSAQVVEGIEQMKGKLGQAGAVLGSDDFQNLFTGLGDLSAAETKFEEAGTALQGASAVNDARSKLQTAASQAESAGASLQDAADAVAAMKSDAGDAAASAGGAASSAADAKASANSAASILNNLDTDGMTTEQKKAIEKAASEAAAAASSAGSAAADAASAKSSADAATTDATTANSAIASAGAAAGTLKDAITTTGDAAKATGDAASAAKEALEKAKEGQDALDGVDFTKVNAQVTGLASELTGAVGQIGDKGDATTLLGGANAINVGLGQATNALERNDGLINGQAQITNGLKLLRNGDSDAKTTGLKDAVSSLGDADTPGTLIGGAAAMDAGLRQLRGDGTTGLTAAKAGALQLSGGLSQLNEAVPALAAGIQALKEGSAQLADGLDAATDGAGQLADGIQQLNDEGIQKIVDAYNDNLAGLSDRLKATVQAGKDYDTFTGKSDAMKGSVKFIYETDAIEIEE